MTKVLFNQPQCLKPLVISKSYFNKMTMKYIVLTNIYTLYYKINSKNGIIIYRHVIKFCPENKVAKLLFNEAGHRAPDP